MREDDLDAAGGPSHPPARSASALVTWVREVEQWHSGSGLAQRGSAVEVLLEDRAERAGRRFGDRRRLG